MKEFKEELVKIFGEDGWFFPLIVVGLLVAGLILPWQFADIVVYGAIGWLLHQYIFKPLQALWKMKIWPSIKSWWAGLF
jgi:hypothetical protein